MQSITVISKSEKKEYTIVLPSGNGEKVSTCPICSPERKKKNDKCLGYNTLSKIGRCNHCGEAFYEKSNYTEMNKLIHPKKSYIKPKLDTFSISDGVAKYFKESRSIGLETLKKLKVSDALVFMPQEKKEVTAILFPYYVNNEIVNIKYRDAKKNFKLEKGCELVMYNLDSVTREIDSYGKVYNTCYIVEGEIDALSFIECGIENVISVPNGATTGKINMEYLDNSIQYIFDKEEFIIATDNDQAGINLRNEIARRLGEYRCSYIVFGENKDANECLVKEGKEKFLEYVNNKRKFPIQGVFTANDILSEIDDYYYNGLPVGCGIGEGLDEFLKFHLGYLTIITGIPGMGKSEYLDFIITKLNVMYGWKAALYSPENYPLQLHFSKFAEKIIGKPFGGEYRMHKSELDKCKDYFSKNFFFIKPEQDFSVESILNTVSNLIMINGINCFVIDAWNKLDHNYTDNETKYISKQLDIIVNFCERNNVHCFLVAHPTKIMKDKQTGLYEVPTLYNINGSANFFNKTANGITVHIDRQTMKTHIYVQKVKFKHWGKVGTFELTWDRDNGRYYSLGRDNTNWLVNGGNIEIDYSSGEINNAPF